MCDRQRQSIAILGTRGIPARYGGFETLAEELAPRLAERGHTVWVYARRHSIGQLPDSPVPGRGSYRGVTVRVLRAPRFKHMETVVHTLLSAADSVRREFDSVLLCNTANALSIPLLRLTRARVVVHTDGIEWRRRKWGRIARAWHRLGAGWSARWADALIADSHFVQRFWQAEFGAAAVFIPYGAPTQPVASAAVLDELGIEPRRYVLYVARLEPENNPDLVIEAFRDVRTELKLVLVGDAPYAQRLGRRVAELAAADPRIVLAGPRYGQAYAELQSHAACYVQASEVGGTHPALLEAMGFGGKVIVNDIPEHREVVGDAALVYEFNRPQSLTRCLQLVLDDPGRGERLESAARDRVRSLYDWERVADAYEGLLLGEAGCR